MKPSRLGTLLLILVVSIGAAAVDDNLVNYRVAFWQSSGGYAQIPIWSMNPDGSDQTLLATVNDPNPVISSDGEFVIYKANWNGSSENERWDLQVLEGDTGTLYPLTIQERTSYPAWSPDSQQVLFVARGTTLLNREDKLYIVNRNGTNRILLFEGEEFMDAPTWSPDGSTILFVSRRHDTYQDTMYAIHPDGTNLRAWLTPDGACFICDSPRFTPDGKALVYMLYPDLHIADAACIDRAEGCGGVAQKYTDLDSVYNAVDVQYARYKWLTYVVSSDRSFLMYTFGFRRKGGGADITRVNLEPDGWDSRTVLYHSSTVSNGVLSPDDQYIFFSDLRADGTTQAIFRMNVDGSDVRELATGYFMRLITP